MESNGEGGGSSLFAFRGTPCLEKMVSIFGITFCAAVDDTISTFGYRDGNGPLKSILTSWHGPFGIATERNGSGGEGLAVRLLGMVCTDQFPL